MPKGLILFCSNQFLLPCLFFFDSRPCLSCSIKHIPEKTHPWVVRKLFTSFCNGIVLQYHWAKFLHSRMCSMLVRVQQSNLLLLHVPHEKDLMFNSRFATCITWDCKFSTGVWQCAAITMQAQHSSCNRTKIQKWFPLPVPLTAHWMSPNAREEQVEYLSCLILQL